MQKIFSLLLVTVVFASVLGQVLAVPSLQSQPAQQSVSTPQTNYLEGCHLLNRTYSMRDYYGNLTDCHGDKRPHLDRDVQVDSD